MPKADVKKDLKHLYQPSAKEVSAVDVPEMSFLMIDGQGNPYTSQEYQEAMETLYAIAYQLKLTVKARHPDLDYVVPPLEGLWWRRHQSTHHGGQGWQRSEACGGDVPQPPSVNPTRGDSVASE